MRARAPTLLLLALLVAACGARITIRSPIRVRFGRPTTTVTLAVVVSLPSTPKLVLSPTPPTATPMPPSPTPTPSTAVTATLTPTASSTVGEPTASATAPHTPTPAASATPDEATAEATPVATPPPRRPATAGNHAVRFLQLRFSVRGEFVQLVNRGPDQDLSGWRLTGANGDPAFAFPSGYILRQGETVTVHSGSEDVPSEPGHLLWTTQRMWPEAFQEVLLHDAQGRVVDRFPRQ